MLAQLTGFGVINAGISGRLTRQRLERYEQLINEANPQLTALLESGNDILQNKSFTQAKQHLEAMITVATHKNIQVVLTGMP